MPPYRLRHVRLEAQPHEVLRGAAAATAAVENARRVSFGIRLNHADHGAAEQCRPAHRRRRALLRRAHVVERVLDLALVDQRLQILGETC